MNTPLPVLHVEGPDDVGVINALLKRHGVDTKSGEEFLKIKGHGSDTGVFREMGTAISLSMDTPVGFVVDIDVECDDRWNKVVGHLTSLKLKPPASCPSGGYIGRLPEYPHAFGVWLMPDCVTSNQKLEHLCKTLIDQDDRLWKFAVETTGRVYSTLEVSDEQGTGPTGKQVTFKQADQIKAEIHAWLAWQKEPGIRMGAAINAKILGHDSAQAINFLKWIRSLYGFVDLKLP